MHSVDNIQGICFDLFNTLVSVGKVPAHVGPSTAEILGVDIQSWREACFGKHHDICGPTDAIDNLRRMAHSIKPGISETAIQKAVRVRQRRFDHALLHVDDEVLTVLGSLRQKYGMRLALVSNASTAEVQAWPASPLAALFDATVFSCHCGSMKPEPAIYQLALRELGLAPQSCLFVGDGGSNEHHGAHAVGMKPVLLRRYLQPPRHQQLEQELAAVLTASIHSLTELRDWF
jgi:putative hydrolase of the HAD superfamily